MGAMVHHSLPVSAGIFSPASQSVEDFLMDFNEGSLMAVLSYFVTIVAA